MPEVVQAYPSDGGRTLCRGTARRQPYGLSSAIFSSIATTTVQRRQAANFISSCRGKLTMLVWSQSRTATAPGSDGRVSYRAESAAVTPPLAGATPG